jgi:Leucine-rich repeat (LRR) protein
MLSPKVKYFFDISENLHSLSLAQNQIESFPSLALRPIHQMITLHVDENKISRIEEDAFQGFGEHIQFLWMQNNM